MRSRRAARALCCAFACALPCWPALAQVSGSLTFESDYLYRGRSLSEGKPVGQLNLVYDHPAGWYAGAYAANMKRSDGQGSAGRYITYAGYAQRLMSGTSWDVAVSNYAYPAESRTTYSEIKFGVTRDRLGAGIAYSPNYVGTNVRTLYAQIDGAYPLGEQANLFAHIGYLRKLGELPPYVQRRALDGRVGVGTALAGWQYQLAFDGLHVDTGRDGLYGAAVSGSRKGMVVSARRPF